MKKFLAGFLCCLALMGVGKLVAEGYHFEHHSVFTEAKTIESLDEIAHQLSRVADAIERKK